MPFPDLRGVLTRALGSQYRLGEEVGRGGMGVVFRATDLTLQRDVAVKVLNPDLVGHPTVAARFLSEARIIARLRHPNIVPVHTAGEAEGLLYYVMDFVPGETLRRRLEREPRLPAPLAARFAADLASALDAASAAGVVHRDLKPENILIEGGGTRALLTDFGVARVLEGSEHGTGPGVAMGTPAYMSPEQAAGESIDARSDLYALGVVTYEMLAGRPPFDGPNRVVLSRQIMDPPTPVTTHRPDLPPALAAAVMHALEKVPEARYQTGAEFRSALLADQPVTPSGTPPRSAAVRRRRGVRLAAFGVVAALVALAVWLVPPDGPPPGVNPRQSLLILPFDNLRDNRDLDWLGDGSVSMLSLALSQWRDLTVVDGDRLHDLLEDAGPRTGPVGLELARRLAREAGVWTVVLGDYTQAGDSLVLVARTYDVASGARLDLAQVAGSGGGDVRPLFDELARRLLDISGGGSARLSALSAVTTWSLEAYRAYLAGADHLHHWDLADAETDLARAIELDSTFALAHFRLALTRGWRYGEGDSVAVVAVGRAARHAGRLPERERTMISAYRAMVESDFARSEELYRQILTRDSTDADAWYGLGDALFHHPGMNSAVGRTQSLRAFRRATRLDPRYVLAYEHVNAILSEAAAPNPYLALVTPDSFQVARASGARPLLDAATLQRAVTLARTEGLAVAQSWVEAQPETPRAHVALFSAHLASRNFPAALQESVRIRALLPDSARGFASFLEARVRFASGDPVGAGRAVRDGMRQLRPSRAATAAIGASPLADVLTGANILAYLGDIDGAVSLVGFADTLRRTLLPPETSAASGPSGRAEAWEWARQAQLYSAAGGAGPQLEGLWRAASGAARSLAPSQQRALARSLAAAPIGLFMLNPRSPAPLRELERLSGTTSDPGLLALEAVHRGDTALARSILAGGSGADSAKAASTKEAEANEVRLWGFANGDSRPVTAEVLYLLGEYQAAVEVLQAFQPDQLSDRQFDPRWAVLGRVRILRGLALERLGRLADAAREFDETLAQWREADAVLLPYVDEARAGLLRVRGAGTGEP